MEIFEATDGAVMILQVGGRVNSTNAPLLSARLERIIAAGQRGLVVDLSRLDHITSAGLRSLLLADQMAADRQGRLVLCGLTGLTLELFEIGGFLEMFDVAASRDEATRRAGRGPVA